MDNIQDLIDNYHPSKETIELVQRTKISLLVGISGAGKDTIKRELIKRSDYCDIVSHTTRPIRKNKVFSELPGVDYHFVDQETAVQMIKDKKFVEVKLVHGNVLYGTSASELEHANDESKIAITDIDVQGASEYEQISNKVISIFILPPDYNTWLLRLQKRYALFSDFESEWPKRRESAKKELTQALKAPYYHFVINDDLERAINEVDQISHGENILENSNARLLAQEILNKIS